MDEKIEQLAKDLKLIKELQASDIYTANYQEARALFSLGYRKESDTAREILTELLYFVNGWFEGVENNDFGVEFNRISKDFAEKYGVEIKE